MSRMEKPVSESSLFSHYFILVLSLYFLIIQSPPSESDKGYGFSFLIKMYIYSDITYMWKLKIQQTSEYNKKEAGRGIGKMAEETRRSPSFPQIQ